MQIYPEAEPFTHLAKVPFGVKQYRDFVDEVPPENGDFLISGILFSIFGHCEKLLWIG